MVLVNYAKKKVGQSIKRPQNGNDVRIDLKPALMVTGANVYITGMKMGV